MNFHKDETSVLHTRTRYQDCSVRTRHLVS